MKVLQIKYCGSEAEANEFLKTLHLDNCEYPRLHAIQYCAKVYGSGGDLESGGEVKSEISVGSDIYAIVQYLVEAE